MKFTKREALRAANNLFTDRHPELLNWRLPLQDDPIETRGFVKVLVDELNNHQEIIGRIVVHANVYSSDMK